MRIATVQLDALLGDVRGNIAKADSLLAGQKERLDGLDLLVLPELAFAGQFLQFGPLIPKLQSAANIEAASYMITGYNHKSFADIEPYLEPTSAGSSTLWAQRTARLLRCLVAIGYAERDVSATPTRAYNSLVFVNSLGEVVAHTRKSFLYYTDESWASEGQGFFAGEVPLGPSLQVQKIAAGICMDINPYKFEAPWTAYEFANHALTSAAELVVLSTAWLTRLSKEELQGHAQSPDLDTVGYWLERMRPLMGPNGPRQEVVLVFANRCGDDGEAPLIEQVRYAGSSTVMGISRGDGRLDGEVRIWDMLGRAEEGVLLVDTTNLPKYALKKALPGEGLSADNTPGSSDNG